MCMIEQPDSSDPQSRYAADERGARLMSTRSRRADGEHGPATRPVHSHRPAAEDLLDRVTEVLRGRERTLGAVVGDEVAPPSLDPGPKRCRTGEETAQVSSSGATRVSISHTVRAAERRPGRPRTASTAAAARIAARCAWMNRSLDSGANWPANSSVSARASRASASALTGAAAAAGALVAAGPRA